MKFNTWIAGAIALIVLICIIGAAAMTMASQGPKSTTSGACSVQGYVFDTMGEGLPGMSVTLHVMGDNGGTEIYNMTATTMDPNTSAGLFVFDNVIITSDTQYAYLSTAVEKDNITYYGCTSNFTMKDNDSIKQSLVLHLPPLAATTIHGNVISSSGTGMAGINVTVHMTGADDDALIPQDLANQSTITGYGDTAGNFTMYVIPVNGTISGYASAEVQVSDNMTIYGRSDKFTFKNGSVVNPVVILRVPPEYLNQTLSKA